MMRQTYIKSLNLKTLNRIETCGNEEFINNFLFNRNSFGSSVNNGLPVSFIVPKSVLVNELELSTTNNGLDGMFEGE
ncbi:MAG: hypothetical protein HC906_14015 [Bacteroidales bacterium]|nr:hypothetical protein [Bacteroidales bacterium]